MARIAHGGFMHETNCFAPGRTTWEMFCVRGDRPPFSRGREVHENLANAAFATSGFLDAMQGRHELVPLVWGSVIAGPMVTREAYERIAGELVAELSRALPVDAVYLDLHGAMHRNSVPVAEPRPLAFIRAQAQITGDRRQVDHDSSLLVLWFHESSALQLILE